MGKNQPLVSNIHDLSLIHIYKSGITVERESPSLIGCVSLSTVITGFMLKLLEGIV